MLKEGEQKKIGTPAGKSGTPGGAAKSPGEKTPIQNKNFHPGNKGKHSIPNPEVLKSSTSKVDKSASIVEVASQEKRVTPRFLVVKNVNGSFEKENPFVLHKLLYGLVGTVKTVKKTREGLFIETVSAAQAERLLATKKLGSHDIEVSGHRTMNSSRVVVFCRDLLNCSVEEICEETRAQGVIDVRRIKKRENGQLVDTPNHILTFNTPKLPDTIKVAFYSLKVRIYIPAPMRCFRCQRFGHTSARCTNPPVCMCGKEPHEGTNCVEPLQCVNCKGNHSARSRNCPVFKQEAAIQEVKTKENISYFEARNKVVVRTPNPGVSYSAAATTVKESKMDTTAIVRELLPQLVVALKTVFVTKDSFVQPVASVPHARSQRTNSPTPSEVSEKRKRVEEEEGFSSEGNSSVYSASSQSSQPVKKKNKKGWPPGKPRKPRDHS